MLDWLVSQPLVLAAVWAVMYAFDYVSTLWLARVYETVLLKYVLYERGVELNPNLEKEIAARRGPGIKILAVLTFVFVIIFLSPLAGRYFGEFLAGALLLTWSFINGRHLRNYAYVRFLKHKPDALKGRQEYSYWFMQRMLSSEALTFALLCLFLTLLTWRIFFLAGALVCISLALRAYRLANRKFPAPAAGKMLS